MITRRSLFGTTALILVGALSGCSASVPTVSVPQWVTDANTIATAFAKSLLPALASLTGMTASSISQIQTWVTNLGTLASQLASAAASGTNVNALIALFGQTVNNIVVALTGSALPASVQTLLTAAQTLLPLILSVAGVALAGSTAMSPSAARALLLAAASK